MIFGLYYTTKMKKNKLKYIIIALFYYSGLLSLYFYEQVIRETAFEMLLNYGWTGELHNSLMFWLNNIFYTVNLLFLFTIIVPILIPVVFLIGAGILGTLQFLYHYSWHRQNTRLRDIEEELRKIKGE